MDDYEDDHAISYPDDYEFDEIEDYEEQSLSFELSSLYEHCVLPTVNDAFKNLLIPLIVANVDLRILLYLVPRSKNFSWLVHILTGTSLLFYHFGDDFDLALVFVAFCVIGTCTVTLLSSRSSRSVWIYCLLIVAFNEAWCFQHIRFIRMRSQIMLLFMKLITSQENIQRKEESNEDHDKHSPRMGDFLETLSYLLHPGALILGTWHPPLKNVARAPFSLNCLLSLLKGISCLLCAACLLQTTLVFGFDNYLVPLIFVYLPPSTTWFVAKFVNTYLTALQFRMSHYSMCFLSQAFLEFWGHETVVTKPLDIEFPRSLVDVVVSWNIPMHLWLKKYVFKPCKKRSGDLTSVLVTYAMSSYIHGFNFQIWTVLLTLGVLTWLEFKLRLKFANIYNSCIGSRACSSLSPAMTSQNKCDNGHELESHKVAKPVNAIFSLLAMANLAYLGATFDGREESSFARHVISIWYSLGFYSHAIALVMLITYVILI